MKTDPMKAYPPPDFWEDNARAHVLKMEGIQPDPTKWVPTLQWLKKALGEIDYLRTTISLHESDHGFY